jgi:BirA family biotin operon repressor/biotin-[acetyl-CoA-carboxylase] ligase
MKKNGKNLLNDYHLLSYDELDSTNEEAKRLAEGGGAHGAVIWAKRQNAGRGRLGRIWVSAEGNLFCSILLSPQCEQDVAAQLSFVAAVAAAEALSSIIPDEDAVNCKWPNDILLGSKKIGGILLESFETPDITTTAHKMQRWVVVGVGINVDSCPVNTDIPATFLKEAGVEIISAKIVLSRFIHHFITDYDLWVSKGFAPIRKKWLQHAFRIGKPIEVRLPKQTYTGVFEGIDAGGQLLLRAPGNKKRLSISAGDVFW